MTIRLNLGSGNLKLDGYENIDLKDGQSAYPLNYTEGSVDEIRASHLLEHFGQNQIADVLKNWVACLKDGGILRIAVPDFKKISQNYIDGKPENTAGYLMGGQTDENDFHKSIFDKTTLTDLMKAAGLTDIAEWKSEITDCASLPISLNLMGIKRQNAENRTLNIELLRRTNEEIAAKKSNKYSQGGEDGIIEEIFRRISTKNKWCFEAGAGNGIFFSNTRKLVEDGWNAVLVECDVKQFEDLLSNNLSHDPSIKCLCLNRKLEQKGANSIENILWECKVPQDIDLVSIDIDGQDYHIFNSMMEFRPRVVIIEFALPADQERFKGEDFIPTIDGDGQAGSQAIIKLAVGKNYIPVVQTGTNIILVRHEEINKLCGPSVQEEKPVKVRAVMSMPRLAFTDNIFCSVREAVVGLNIDLEKGSGVFWGQVLTRMIGSHLNDGTDYILTVDYDTWFKKEHIMRMLQLMEEHPEIDAIIPLQVKRENDLVMFSKADKNGRPIDRVPLEEFYKDLTPIVNGHFGLTIFRASALKKLKKPWFLPVPDKDGGWEDGHTDEDIYFWQNFYASGCRAFLAPKVNIGHLQLMVTFPGEIKENWKPTYSYLTDVEKGKVPVHCVPVINLLK